MRRGGRIAGICGMSYAICNERVGKGSRQRSFTGQAFGDSEVAGRGGAERDSSLNITTARGIRAYASSRQLFSKLIYDFTE